MSIIYLGGQKMTALVIALVCIAVIVLLSKFMPDIIKSIPAIIGLIIIVCIVGGVAFFIWIGTFMTGC